MKPLNSSFRDPSGYIFNNNDKFYRVVNNSYKENLDHLEDSGLYDKLLESKKVIPYEQVLNTSLDSDKDVYKVIIPEQLGFVSYPYEWCFSQLKDAALLTLDIQRESLKYDMSLKDASAYNVQFHRGLPVMIDTLSFEKYSEGDPWVAYKQFCQHFLAPLALASYVDIKSIKLLQLYIDGIPLDYAIKQLPVRFIAKFSIFIHLYLHAKAQNSNANNFKIRKNNVSKVAMLGLISSLRSAIDSLKWAPVGTEWGEYYQATNYSTSSMSKKHQVIDEIIFSLSPSVLWDIGGNNGEFTRIASNKGIDSILFDIDYASIEKSYRKSKKEKERNLASFVMDFTNPSPSIGWNNKERLSIFNRKPADMVLALALIHHLCISNNLPFNFVMEFFARITSKYLVIEFVPKSDSQVKRLLKTREDIFINYNQNNFENNFMNLFNIIKTIKVDDSERVIYLMEKKI
jgi:hypothetical protein